MKRFLYTEEQLQYLREIAPGKSTYEITDLFNARFGTEKARNHITSCMKNYKIHSGMAHKIKRQGSYKTLTTPEQDNAIRERFHEKGTGSFREVQKFLAEEYDVHLTLSQIKYLLTNRGIKLGHHGYFSVGHKPSFLGRKHTPEAIAKMRNTMFVKGNRPHNTLPVGTEQVDSMGYVRVKVADPNKWVFKSHMLWEQETGEQLEEDERIVFLDGNKLNVTVDNLAKVNISELAYLNLSYGISSDAEITKACLGLVKLSRAIARRSRDVAK